MGLICALASSLIFASQGTVLITGGILFDGTGSPGRAADIRIEGNLISQIGDLTPRTNEQVIEANGLYISPGFIDSHSHADSDLNNLESQVRQGITTAIAGQDGSRSASVAEQLRRADRGSLINFAFFSGHNGLRTAVLGDKANRRAMPSEITRMGEMLAQDMKDGALGLSTGLEYDPGHYASTYELIDLATIAARNGGIYISHVRDESAGMFESLQEVKEINEKSKIPTQISHIKLAIAPNWGRAKEVLRFLDLERQQGRDLTADVYPYLYWQSTIRALTPGRDYENRQTWVDALKDVGGPANVRLTSFEPKRRSSLAIQPGKTLAELETSTGVKAPEIIMEIIRATEGGGRESVLVNAMTEADLKEFIRHPWVMFCSDGSGGGSHPRGAGSFPRILGRYVRETATITWQEAIRKMTSLPARRFGLTNRGQIKVGQVADLVLFDPYKINDEATPSDPTRFSTGISYVMIDGQFVLHNGRLTDAKPGKGLRRNP